MKKLNASKMKATAGGFLCVDNPGNGNGNAYGTCFPTLCMFVGGILASNPSASHNFEVCPL
jgi:hypothetical protein